MSLENQIYVRKSCRKYLDEKIDINLIYDFMKNVKPLDDNIEYYYEILTPDEMNIRTRWTAPYYLALFSEKKELAGGKLGFHIPAIVIVFSKS